MPERRSPGDDAPVTQPRGFGRAEWESALQRGDAFVVEVPARRNRWVPRGLLVTWRLLVMTVRARRPRRG